MPIYTKPLKHRLRHANYMRERYRNDQEFRLSEINRKRAYSGLPPLRSLAELKPRGGWNRGMGERA
jgi:hypothetical protein